MVKGLVLAGILVMAGVTMAAATKLTGSVGWGCFVTIVVWVFLAIGAYEILAA